MCVCTCVFICVCVCVCVGCHRWCFISVDDLANKKRKLEEHTLRPAASFHCPSAGSSGCRWPKHFLPPIQTSPGLGRSVTALLLLSSQHFINTSATLTALCYNYSHMFYLHPEHELQDTLPHSSLQFPCLL